MSEHQSAPPPVANSGEDAITHTIDVEPEQFASEFESLSDAYEVETTVHQIVDGAYQRVSSSPQSASVLQAKCIFHPQIALQFPDELLHDSVQIYHLLRARLEAHIELYVLADTTYGSCCVDEVAAQHVDADLIVHYGHTCLSPTLRLPVNYVLTKRPVDPSHAANSLASTSKESLDQDRRAIVLMYDVAYAYKAHLIFDQLEPLVNLPLSMARIDRRTNRVNKKGKSSVQSEDEAASASAPTRATTQDEPVENDGDDTTPPDGVSNVAPAPTPEGLVPSETMPIRPTPPRIAYELPEGTTIDDCAIFYIGGESLALNNILMTHGKCPVWSYDPRTKEARLESSKTNRMLMRRYATVEKAKDSDVIGILIGTLGVASYLPLIKHLRELIASHQKKSYTVAVGKLNPAKLANFMEVECFVLVACPENTLIDSKEFLRPIVTPFELELALTSKNWTGEYVLDFETLLATSDFGQDFVDPAKDEEDEEGPVFSSTTGKYRHPKRYATKGVTNADDLTAQASALSIRNTSSAVAQVLGSAAGDFLSNRTYRGLEPRYGMDAPAVIEQGREGGIARGYGYEKSAEP
ncbi:BZ3500_MvSof-1268-A1-R1_Chr9g10537 [Microbotryum saponariae]|uniref:2-(3-amino-3-carboxypropyl)histidine synthase subunit 2 n=1 Tax=Microbotryum saponariae TaxID=289078 RepID=A0A2X0MEI2_9BASI|nr:BZ3501_MvSof-1269-A2-R1_Chr9g10286 [Microbotryum saponariae]SDA00257.1 BZ3500_MvSof-1268-A1-R1_Chr9g10537 [Microbotryum saponariae]